MPPSPQRLPFAQWMEQALFDPAKGYYTARIRTVGRQGDFSTSATASSLLGEAIAHWLMEEQKAQPQVKHVIEVGGGDGSLSLAVRKALGWWRRRSLRWHLVEASPILKQKQQEKLKGSSASWHESMIEALQACDGSAFIFHNELVDAFPVTILQWDATAKNWQELWLEASPTGWQETWQAPTSVEATPFTALQQWHAATPPPYDGQRVELHGSYAAWQREWAPHWHAGAMLTVDYGDTFPSLYHRQPRGTIRAYLMHQRFTGPGVYANMGRQDITTDVNFSDLLAWGQTLHWTHDPLQTQRDFLQQHVPKFTERIEADPAAAFLTDDLGVGTAFKALIQRPTSTSL